MGGADAPLIPMGLFRALYLSNYTQYPNIRNGHIRHGAEISGNFKKLLLKGSNLRKALK